MKVDKKKTMTIFALTLLITSLLLINMNGTTTAQPSTDLHLHGPPLQPIHMHSNITLNPIHMHHTKGILWPGEWPITEPNCTTDWLKIVPDLDPPFEVWHLSSWDDVGDPIGELSPNDQIDMTNIDTQDVEWFHVDRMTLTLNLSGPYPGPTHEPGPTSMLLEMKQPYCNPYDPYAVYDPLFTVWHQVWPLYSPIFTITNWINDPFNPNTVLDYTDSISFDQGFTWWHVEDVATDLILRWKMMDPKGTWWHELYPDYCEGYNLTSWSSFPDPWCDRISPKDTIDMFRFSDQTTHWYFVDRVTITINVTSVEPPFDWMMLELKTHYFEEMYHYIKKPLDSFWHEVYPEYCTVFNLTWWDPMDPLWDNCNGVLDPCDHIELRNMTDGSYMAYHITDMSYDIILNEYITDPVCTDWHELYPDCTLDEYHIDYWENNTMDVWLSPCDNVTLSDPTGLPGDYHVKNVTLTLNVTIEDISGTGPFMTIGERIYLEYLQGAWNYSWPRLYHPKIEPWDTNWTVVCPPGYFGEPFTIWDWWDNCNGVLDYCDTLHLIGSSQELYVHVDEVAVDMVVQKIGEEPPPPPQLYWKADYPEYAPSGVPDFDQKQDAWGNNQYMPPWNWTWCGPTAVANSLWWMDSRYHPSNLLTAYVGALSEHDPTNVPPFIQHLAYLMDTEGQRTGIPHRGTNVLDMEAGIIQYLQWTGVNPPGDVNGDGIVDAVDQVIVMVAMGTVPGGIGWDMRADIHPVTTGWPVPGVANNVIDANDLLIVTNHMGWTNGTFYVHTIPAPTFQQIEMEVEKCQDVVLLIAPWWQAETRYSEAAHFVTVAGVNSTTRKIALSDPMFNAFETGLTPEGRQLPVGVVHNHPANPPDTTHNNASLVSHDIYAVTNATPCQGGPESIVNYPGFGPGYVWQIEFAVITSPLEEEVVDVAVTDVVPWKEYCSVPVSQAYPHVGWTVHVNVTAKNNGDAPATFTVSAYANETLVGTQPVNNLPAGQNTTLTFNWNPAGVSFGYYPIKANATLVGDTNPGNNEHLNGQVLVKVFGDVDANGKVDAIDVFSHVALAYGTSFGNPKYECQSDFDGDGDVDPTDVFSYIALWYDPVKTWPYP